MNNINKILITTGLCAVLLSTGCASTPVNRSTAVNDARLHTNVTRSFDGHTANNNHAARNRFGSPNGRSYNVRRSHGATTNNYPQTSAVNRRENLPLVEVDKPVEHNRHIRKEHRRLNTNSQERKHTPARVKTNRSEFKRSHEVSRTPQHSLNHTPSRAHAVTRNHTALANNRYEHENVDGRGLLRGYEVAKPYSMGRFADNGYVRNYNDGFDGRIRDYRFENALGRDYGYNNRGYGHARHHGFFPTRALTNAADRGANVLRRAANDLGRNSRLDELHGRFERDNYAAGLNGYGYGSNIAGYGSRTGAANGYANGLNGRIVNVPYTHDLESVS